MIRVIIENIPNTSDTEAEILGTIHINEMDKSTDNFADYQYVIDNNWDKSGRIDRHFRTNSIWKLVYKILQMEYRDDS